MPEKKNTEQTPSGNEPVYYLIEQEKDIIIKEKEGRTKKGDFAQQRISRFRSPKNVIVYLKEKYGEKF